MPRSMKMSKTGSSVRGTAVGVALALAAITLIVFAPVRDYAFVSIDDPVYVTENPHVAHGLTAAGIAWAFTSGYAANWHPLTWLSHMLDVQLFGLAPGPPHVVNLILHTLNAVLLFVLLRLATRRTWPSAFVAALFAVHPLHVESVAWVAERKDVLSTFFWMLTMLAYVRYVRTAEGSNRGARVAYALVLLLFALGLLAKPMLVTLPLVLLLLDVWPLARVEITKSDSPTVRLRALVVEKLPLFALAAVSTIVTFLAQQRGGAVSQLAVVPLSHRVANALTSYLAYATKMFWPARLSVFYRYPDTLSIFTAAGAATILAVVSVLVFRQLRSRPYLAVGWLWYVVTLVPVIGIVQIGRQAMADRYTYVPLVGLFVMIAWGVPDILVRRRAGRVALPLAVVAVLTCAVVARAQVQYWSSSEALWRHALDVDPRNYFAHNSLGVLDLEAGGIEQAIARFSEAIRIAPDYPEAYHNLGLGYAKQGRTSEAIAQYRQALALNPALARTHDSLGIALLAAGRTSEAISQFEAAIRLQPDLATAHSNLGKALASVGNSDGAIAQYTEALRLDPRLVDAHNNLGVALADRGDAAGAVVHYREALRLKPDQADVRSNLGVALAASGSADEAVAECAAAVRLNPAGAVLHYNLGVVLAGQDRTAEAAAHFAEAVRLQPGLAAAHTRLALALSRQGDLAGAIEHFERAARLQPASDTAHQYLGLALAGAGRFDAAIAELRQALRLNPGNEAARRALQMAVERSGGRPAARK